MGHTPLQRGAVPTAAALLALLLSLSLSAEATLLPTEAAALTAVLGPGHTCGSVGVTCDTSGQKVVSM